jgi:uncharacterized membrane protein YbhN (UPF0104 family)
MWHSLFIFHFFFYFSFYSPFPSLFPLGPLVIRFIFLYSFHLQPYLFLWRERRQSVHKKENRHPQELRLIAAHVATAGLLVLVDAGAALHQTSPREARLSAIDSREAPLGQPPPL